MSQRDQKLGRLALGYFDFDAFPIFALPIAAD
jgi:hypothetical protein